MWLLSPGMRCTRTSSAAGVPSNSAGPAPSCAKKVSRSSFDSSLSASKKEEEDTIDWLPSVSKYFHDKSKVTVISAETTTKGFLKVFMVNFFMVKWSNG